MSSWDVFIEAAFLWRPTTALAVSALSLRFYLGRSRLLPVPHIQQSAARCDARPLLRGHRPDDQPAASR